jgi:hypothetical protein
VGGNEGVTVGAGGPRVGSGAVGWGDSVGPGPSMLIALAAPSVAAPAMENPAIATTST